jgi:hypothetical protein
VILFHSYHYAFSSNQVFPEFLGEHQEPEIVTEEAAKISGIPYVMEAYRSEAEQILAK